MTNVELDINAHFKYIILSIEDPHRINDPVTELYNSKTTKQDDNSPVTKLILKTELKSLLLEMEI